MPEQATQRLKLPDECTALEEANLPADFAAAIAGLAVEVQVLPEEMPGTRPAMPEETGFLIDREGNYWNDYAPLRVVLHDPQGRDWRLPRHWLEGPGRTDEREPDSAYAVEGSLEFQEKLHLPSFWDLVEINIPERVAAGAAGRVTTVRVSLAPGVPVRVFWHDSSGTAWRIPHNWRRRRIRLPGRESLVEQGIPWDVAEEFSHRVVSVNYHPGSLCCLPDQYRFRDAAGDRYPVSIKDCILLGYGDAQEHFA
ncbi:MAG: hypothetical protein ACE141_01905 [Bryobacteraceae bacterium]